jgi:hypothetical protein
MPVEGFVSLIGRCRFNDSISRVSDHLGVSMRISGSSSTMSAISRAVSLIWQKGIDVDVYLSRR